MLSPFGLGTEDEDAMMTRELDAYLSQAPITNAATLLPEGVYGIVPAQTASPCTDTAPRQAASN